MWNQQKGKKGKVFVGTMNDWGRGKGTLNREEGE
jgi:hypothetical protein